MWNKHTDMVFFVLLVDRIYTVQQNLDIHCYFYHNLDRQAVCVKENRMYNHHKYQLNNHLVFVIDILRVNLVYLLMYDHNVRINMLCARNRMIAKTKHWLDRQELYRLNCNQNEVVENI